MSFDVPKEALLRAAEHGDHGAILVAGDWAMERGKLLSEFMSPSADAFEIRDGYGSGGSGEYGCGGGGYGDGDGDGDGDGFGYGYGYGSTSEGDGHGSGYPASDFGDGHGSGPIYGSTSHPQMISIGRVEQ